MTSALSPFEARFAAALRLANDDRLQAAADTFAALVREAPQHAPSRQLLGVVLQRLGQPAQALTELDAAARLLPRNAQIACLRSESLLDLGRVDEAIDAARAVLAIDPALTPARLRLGLALLAARQPRAAIDELERVLAEQPDVLAARLALVRCLLHEGEPERALEQARVVELIDAREIYHAALGDFAAAGARAQRAELLEASLTRHPRDYASAVALASELHLLGYSSRALRWSERALALRPAEILPRQIRALALIDRGDVETGLIAMRELLVHGDAQTAARHLIVMHYDPAQNNESLFAAHVDFAQRHLRTSAPGFERRATDAEKRLRIGWLSPRFSDGPVASFLGNLLACFDRSRHHHVAIALQPARGATATRLITLADESVDASGLDDDALLQKLRLLELDVLIDLAGHATANRLRTVAQRVAPLQLCWLDYFDTTGAPAMDAWISDAWLTPADSTQRYTEHLVQLRSGRLCYSPREDAPAALRNPHAGVVFGSFNRLAKFNDAVVDTWAEILRRVPQAELELRARLLIDQESCAHIRARFEARGINGARLRLHGEQPYLGLLAAYQDIDIALDPFPFSGCTTTCDALWMGCPVITLPGETFVSRQSASLLWRLGRDEWVARDRSDYIERAVALAGDAKALSENRMRLRESVRVHLCDAQAQADDFAHTLRELWRVRCADNP